jgi:hypothetical protein
MGRKRQEEVLVGERDRARGGAGGGALETVCIHQCLLTWTGRVRRNRRKVYSKQKRGMRWMLGATGEEEGGGTMPAEWWEYERKDNTQSVGVGRSEIE